MKKNYLVKWLTNKNIEERNIIETDERKWFDLTKKEQKEIEAENETEALALFQEWFIEKFGGASMLPECDFEKVWKAENETVHYNFTIREKGSNYINGIVICTNHFRL